MRHGPRLLCPVSIVTIALSSPGAILGTDVTVDGARRHQRIEGFGTCLIAWVGRFRDLYRTEAFQKTYVEEVGCTMLRVNMWGPTHRKPTEDWREIRHEDLDFGANGARPGFGAVQVGAFLHEARGELSIVAINSTTEEQPLRLTFRSLEGLDDLETFRTSGSEHLKPAGKLSVRDGKAAFDMKPLSIVTFTGTVGR